jgi:ribonuclease P protein component
MNKPFSLSHHERLKSKKIIDTLFLSGEAFFVFPYKIVFEIKEIADDNTDAALKMGISVPKRLFKRANKRNRIKRLTREVYRLNKPQLLEKVLLGKKVMNIMLIYTAKEEIAFAELQLKIQKIIQKLIKRVGEKPETNF